MKVTFALCLLAAVGCGAGPTVTREYVWVQKANGFGMRGPITYRVRYSWAKDTLVWAENVVDADGKRDIRTHKYYTSSLPGLATLCQYWDDDDWSCSELGVKGEALMSQTMKDGKLTWFYWGENRVMDTRHRIWNKPTPF
jgi:hypothetical protein